MKCIPNPLKQIYFLNDEYFAQGLQVQSGEDEREARQLPRYQDQLARVVRQVSNQDGGTKLPIMASKHTLYPRASDSVLRSQ